MNISSAVIEKFWNNVEKTPTCWNWTGFLSKSKAPIIRVGTHPNFKEYSPRQVSLILANKPASNRSSPHCQNKLCVSPEHLVSGDTARFWSKVQKLSEPDGCWVWIGAQDKDMYGKFTYRQDKKKIDIRAHRYSWELANNWKIGTSTLQVCHRCDHPYCVNPEHLFLGTTQENTEDKVQKGRQARGETCGAAKLTEEKVKEIRELYKTGVSITQLSNQLSIPNSTIHCIVHRITWDYLP
jgi:hypothetical protein